MVAVIFLSTLPARGATKRINALGQTYSISIHAPREGSDVLAPGNDARPLEFLSTLPARGATCGPSVAPEPHKNFYPRSPRGERHEHGGAASRTVNFYPRSPRGERPDCDFRYFFHQHFYPRSPRGERHQGQRHCAAAPIFLSTLPARGATKIDPTDVFYLAKFLSTLPARGATMAG